MRWTPPAPSSKPLEIKDVLGTGITLLTVRSGARAYGPFRDHSEQMRRSLLNARMIGMIQGLPEFARKMLDGEELSEEQAGEAVRQLASVDTDAFAEIGREAAKLATNGHKGPEEAAKVAALVIGWSGAEDDDGAPLEFTAERAVGLLTDGAKGDAAGALLVEGAPYVLQDGPWAGYTMGQALASLIPEEIANLSVAEVLEQASKKKQSTRGRSGRRGSTTGAKKRRRQPTKRSSSAPESKPQSS